MRTAAAAAAAVQSKLAANGMFIPGISVSNSDSPSAPGPRSNCNLRCMSFQDKSKLNI